MIHYSDLIRAINETKDAKEREKSVKQAFVRQHGWYCCEHYWFHADYPGTDSTLAYAVQDSIERWRKATRISQKSPNLLINYEE